MAIPFNPISITIGKDGLSSFKSLRIDQSTGAHHHFDLTVDLESGGNRQVHNISSSKEWLGKDIIVKAANKPFFCGIVTNIELHRDGSDFGCIQVSGYSSTYRMETAPSCYSWNDRSIGDVVKSLCSDGKVQLALNAAHKKQLDYICQYEESDFDFVRRLALQYQEWMYYDGLKLVFGKPRRLPDPIKMEFGTSLSSLNIGLQTLARPEQVFTFHSGANREMDRKTPDKAYGHDRMAGDAFRAALPSYPKAARQYSIQRVSSIDDLENYVLLKQAAETAETHYVTAESQDPRLHVGSVISLYSSFLKGVGNLSQESLGDFIIIEMTHEVSESCYYKNRFKAIPGTVMSLPNPKVEMPLAETQMATVLSNADPHGEGRVQVRMNWQTDNMRTSWVRVMTPDGGGSKDVKSNRGFVFIPEVGDQVLLGFRHGDPARPYVMGSLFNGTTGNGGGSNNSIKSLKTRSGISVILNDDNRSLEIKDAGGSSIHLDGNGNILLNAPKNIQLHAGNDMSLMVGHDLQVNVGNSQTTNIGNMMLTNVMQKILVNTPFMQQLVADFFHTQAGKALLNSQNQIKIEAPETNVVGEQRLFIHSAEKAIVNSQGMIELRGEQGTSEFNQAFSYQKTVEEKAKRCVVYFKRSEHYNGEYGFDWFHLGKQEDMSKGDYKFVDTIGHHYETDNDGKKVTCTDGNAAYKYPFEVLSTQIDKKRNSFEYFNIGFKLAKARIGVTPLEDFTYYIPRMTMMPDTEFNLVAEIELDREENKPKEIKLQFDKADNLKLSHTTLPVRAGKVTLTISCTGELTEKRTLTAVTDDGDTVGTLFILPNSKEHQRDIKVVFVKVKTNLDEKEGEFKTGIVNSSAKTLFLNVLHQALVNVDIEEEIINCTEKSFKERFCIDKTIYKDNIPQKHIVIKDDNITAGKMKKEMLEVLKKEKGDQFDGYYTVFFFGDKSESTNGYAYPNSTYGVFFDGYNSATVPHEMLHAMGLPHSFDYNGVPFAYKYHTTDNIMDYSHLTPNPIKRMSLFYWQWGILNNKIV